MELSITKATKSYGKRRLFEDLSLVLRTGEIVGVFGRNGTGKSTLLKMIFGVLGADVLEITVDGESIPPRDIIKRKLISYLPQDRFLPRFTRVRDIVPMYFDDEETLDRIFYAPGVAKFDGYRYGELSEGQKKYLEILLVSYLGHPFMLLDEPFSMIDPEYTELIGDLLARRKQEKGILLTDHYYHDVLRISDRNYLLREGSLGEVAGEEELRAGGYLSWRMKRL